MTNVVFDAAKLLDGAAVNAVAVPQFAPAMDIRQAYQVQAALIERRIARGERVIGLKMGFTSRAKMLQMGVSDLIWGQLTDGMLVEDGGAITLSRFIHPRAEPEIAFLLNKSLSGRVTPLQALDAVAGVAPAIEIIDSRYQDFKFSLSDVVADNSSSSGFVVGPWASPQRDLANLGMIFSVNGRPVSFSSSAALLGNPLRSLVSAARLAAESGMDLPVGSIIMAGGATAATALKPGMVVDLEVEHLGRVCFSVEGQPS